MKVRVRDIVKVFWRAARPYRLLFFLLLFAIIISNTLDLVPALFLKRFFDTLTHAMPGEAVAHDLIHILLIILLVHLGSWLFGQTSKMINNHFQPRVMVDLVDHGFEYLLGHSYGFFANNFGGALVERLRRLSRCFETFADRLYWDLLPLVLRFGIITTTLWLINPTIAIVLVAWALLYMVLNYFLSLWKLKYDTERAAYSSRVTASLADAITNHTNIQLFTGRLFELKLFRQITSVFRRLMTFTWSLRTVIDAVQGILTVGVEFALFYFAVRYWQVGLLTIGSFVLIQTYFFQLLDRLWDFGRVVRDLYESFADAEEMVAIMQTPHEIGDVPAAKPLAVSRGRVEFKKVQFSFHKTRAVLRDINLAIEPGEKIALIGPSGAGKSTLVKLLFRFYDVDSGKILIDGQDIARVTQESLRANLSLVPQDPILFHRSLMENIRYGRRDATDEAVIAAARLAHCHEFIDELPQKYETFVGERGIKLSGGERQRVAIARAILKNAPILVLDEATSSLDSASERLIQDALEKLMSGKTVMVIAHRLSTIRKMDRIVVLDHGQVVEEGTHDTLVRKGKSLYHKLWKFQAGGFLQDIEDG